MPDASSTILSPDRLGADLVGHPLRVNPQKQVNPPSENIASTQAVTILSAKHPTDKHIGAAWYGKKDVRVVERPKPVITDGNDVILRVTSTCICGSDLHLYLGAMLGMEKGSLLGHEFMGIVEDAGPGVKGFKKGDRVCACFDIGCGSCQCCSKQLYSCCDSTNPSKGEKALYGDNTGGFYGYSHLTGGWEGGQAEFVRVPFADVNLLHVPDDLPDERVVLLSDVLPTAYHACQLGEVGQGDVVAIWGAGPVGILAAHCAKHLGADRVILIDCYDYRLQHAAAKVPGTETINYSSVKDVVQEIRRLVPSGPDVCIDAVGFHYTKDLSLVGIVHKIEMAVAMETDPSIVLNECIKACRKGGRVSIIGAYAGYTNHFNIGAMMEKSLTMRGGQTPCQKYWPELLEKVKTGQLDPTIVITHQMPLAEASKAYKMFNEKEDGMIKVILKPGMKAGEGTSTPAGTSAVPEPAPGPHSSGFKADATVAGSGPTAGVETLQQVAEQIKGEDAVVEGGAIAI